MTDPFEGKCEPWDDILDLIAQSDAEFLKKPDYCEWDHLLDVAIDAAGDSATMNRPDQPNLQPQPQPAAGADPLATWANSIVAHVGDTIAGTPIPHGIQPGQLQLRPAIITTLRDRCYRGTKSSVTRHAVTNHLTLLSLMVRCILYFQKRGFEQTVKAIQRAPVTWRFFNIMDSWDETRQKLAFGTIGNLFEYAQRKIQARRTLTDEEKKIIIARMKRNRWAIFDVFVRAVNISWGRGIDDREKLFCTSSILERNTASNLGEVMVRSLPILKAETVTMLAMFVTIILYAIVADKATGNRLYIKNRRRSLPNNVAQYESDCKVHSFSKGMHYVNKSENAYGLLYSAQKLLNQADHFMTLLAAWVVVCRKNFEHVPVEPDPAWKRDTTRILRRSLMREDWGITASRHPCLPANGPAATRPPVGAENKRVQIGKMVRSAFNGPWWEKKFLHYCVNPHCNHLQECLDAGSELLSVMYPEGLLQENKWDSEDAIRCFLDMMLHFGPSIDAFAVAWGDARIDQDAGGADEVLDPNSSAAMSKRKNKLVGLVNDRHQQMLIKTTNIISEPQSSFLRYVTFADDPHNRKTHKIRPMVLQLISEDPLVNPVERIRLDYAELLEADSDLFVAIERDMRKINSVAEREMLWDTWAVKSASFLLLCDAVASREEGIIGEFPIRAFESVSPDPTVRANAAGRAFDKAKCCSGHFLDKLTKIAMTPWEYAHGPINDALTDLADEVEITVLGRERAHSTNLKLASTRTQNTITAERLQLSGVVGQFVREHEKCGGLSLDACEHKEFATVDTIRKERQRKK